MNVNDAIQALGLFDPPRPAPKPCESCGVETRVVLRYQGARGDVPCCGLPACVGAIAGRARG